MKLYMPKKIKIGYQNRSDTYTKKLAYVIYYDDKGKLRKEASWSSWRDKKIEPTECDNEPTEGFVLNRHGGHTGSSSWYDFGRNAFVRVWDPRDFEFEISVENLLFILRDCDCTKGKGLEGKFVYAWQGTNLVLLPTSSKEYQDSLSYTSLQSKKFSLRDLREGHTYETKDEKKLIYLGRFFKHYKEGWRGDDRKNYHVFHDGTHFRFLNSGKDIAQEISDSVATNYAELVESYNKSKYGSKPVKIELVEFNETNEDRWYLKWSYEQYPGTYINITYDKHNKSLTINHRIKIENGKINCVKQNQIIRNDEIKYYSYNSIYDPDLYNKLMQCTTKRLVVTLESGSQFELCGHNYLEGYSY